MKMSGRGINMVSFFVTSQDWGRLILVALVVSILFPILGALFGGVMFYAQGRQSEIVEKEKARELASTLERERLTSLEKIAEAKADASAKIARANAEAAKANEGLAKAHAEIEAAKVSAAKANKEAAEANKQAQGAVLAQEELRQENLKLTTRLNETVIHVQSTKTALVSAQQSLAKQATRQSIQGHQISQQGHQIQPRSLTAQQQQQLLTMLQSGPTGPVQVNCLSGDVEALSFAIQLSNLLEKAGWQTGGVTQVVMPGVPIGLAIMVRNVQTAPPYAAKLQQSMDSLGYPAPGIVMSGMPERTVTLFVGTKPLQNLK